VLPPAALPAESSDYVVTTDSVLVGTPDCAQGSAGQPAEPNNQPLEQPNTAEITAGDASLLESPQDRAAAAPPSPAAEAQSRPGHESVPHLA
jgi:hypothetical protein